MANSSPASPCQARISSSLFIPKKASSYKKAKFPLQSLRFFVEIRLQRRHSPGRHGMEGIRSEGRHGTPIILQCPGPSHFTRHMLRISGKLPTLNLHSRIPFLCWKMRINVWDLIHIRTLVIGVGKGQVLGQERYVCHFRKGTRQLTNSSIQGSTCQPFKMPILWLDIFPSRLPSASRKNRLLPSAAKVDMSTLWER